MKKTIATEEALEKTLQTLIKSIDGLDGKVQKEISFKRSFLLSIVRGMGYTLGATMVASLVVFLLAYILNLVQYIPLLRDYLDTSIVHTILGQMESSGGVR